MGLLTLDVGYYAMTYNGNAVGTIELGSPNLQFTTESRRIDDTTQYGNTLVEGIYMGVNATLLVMLKEWTANAQATLFPGGAAAFDGTLGVIGRQMTDLGAAIVLTPEAGSPAATNGQTFTASKCAVSPASQIAKEFSPGMKNVPILFDLYAYDDTGTKRLWKLS